MIDEQVSAVRTLTLFVWGRGCTPIVIVIVVVGHGVGGGG